MKTLFQRVVLVVAIASVGGCADFDGVEFSQYQGYGYEPSMFDSPYAYGSPFGFDDGFPEPFYDGGPGMNFYNGGMPEPGWDEGRWDDDD